MARSSSSIRLYATPRNEWTELKPSLSRRPDSMARVQAAIALSLEPLAQVATSVVDPGSKENSFVVAVLKTDIVAATRRVSDLIVATANAAPATNMTATMT